MSTALHWLVTSAGFEKTFARKVFKSCPSERMLPMTVDFGIRLSRYPDDPAEDTHAYYECTLNSLSEHITTISRKEIVPISNRGF